MAWDSSRPVPWRRLIREWLIYVVIAATAITIYYVATDRSIDVGLFSGLLASGPMYVLFGAALAKFGYQRKTFRDLRNERPAAATSRSAAAGAAGATATSVRTRPAPTKRTSTGPSQHRKNTKPKRR
jgi:hypothetical protein